VGVFVADSRDSITWVALELTRVGEQRVAEGTLEEALRRDLDLEPDHPVFILAVTYKKASRMVTLQLMEGYAFVATGKPEVAYIALEKKSTYVRKVMSIEGPNEVRALSVIPNSYIEELQEQIRGLVTSDLVRGTKVKIVGGKYRYLDGEVLYVDNDNATVRITLRSLDIITELPKAFLEVFDES